MQTDNILEKRENENTIAAQYFHGEERFNCCQAVMKAYSNKTGMTDDQIREQYHGFGGGRAPEGLCGALHAARELLNEEEFRKLMDEFAQSADATTCRDIRRAKKLPCVQCVELVGKLLQEEEIQVKKDNIS